MSRPDPPSLAAPDPCPPLPWLPACLTCGHPLIAHGQRGCRADVDGLRCGCTRFTTSTPDTSEEPPCQ
ncbi:hypothetical protein MXD59_22790 [Frankia sp. Ag45/Mut15]|uniref:Uncharacterized protein n=1 Tax=Frankia umida TaxID=573489 RepID=A0ABT0K441_9ACTN|nr:hypothetical protein [Frankia umida]MCK9878555.1 hypothetical protein [Frankia umida]